MQDNIGIVKRDKTAIPFFSLPPRIRPDDVAEYKQNMESLFFQNTASIEDVAGNDWVKIITGDPTMLREQAKTLVSLAQSNGGGVWPTILSGGSAPAYKKFSLEFIGAAAIEILKGTFDFDLKLPESFRLFNRAFGKGQTYLEFEKPSPEGFRRPVSRNRDGSLKCVLDMSSTNTYENLEAAYKIMVEYNLNKPEEKKIAIFANCEAARAVETFKTVVDKLAPAGTAYEVKGVFVDPKKFKNWYGNLWLHSRLTSEYWRLVKYSSGDVAKPIKLHGSTQHYVNIIADLIEKGKKSKKGKGR